MFAYQHCSNATHLHLHSVPVQLDPVLHSHPENVTLSKVLLLSFSLTVIPLRHDTFTMRYINYSHTTCHRLLVSFSRIIKLENCLNDNLAKLIKLIKADSSCSGSNNNKSLAVANDHRRSETASTEVLGDVGENERKMKGCSSNTPVIANTLKEEQPSANRSN